MNFRRTSLLLMNGVTFLENVARIHVLPVMRQRFPQRRGGNQESAKPAAAKDASKPAAIKDASKSPATDKKP